MPNSKEFYRHFENMFSLSEILFLKFIGKELNHLQYDNNNYHKIVMPLTSSPAL